VIQALPIPRLLTDDPLFPRLKQHVVDATGLSYYANKDADLAHRISRRLEGLGVVDCASYLAVLQDPLRGPSELDALIAEITIGESYFFRHREHFDALRDTVLPDLLKRNRANRLLRVWCAGCADGAEPYSLAILLKGEMAQQLQGWNVTILGTDINRRFLARAREGSFEEWALRSTPGDIRDAWFLKEGKVWKVAPQCKEWVSFRYHNLAEHSFPSLLNNLCAFDLIICRNVMIYFGPELMRKTVGQFHERLAPGGWLLVGPTEPNMTSFTSFHAVNAPGVTLYQKRDQCIQSQSAPEEGEGAFSTPSIPPQFPVACANLPVIETPAKENICLTLADVRRHADQGSWEDATRCCEALLERDNLNSTVHFCHALILEQTKNHAAAEKSLRRAIYLDRRYVLAHYYLGLALQTRGDPLQAARSFGNALELLRRRNDADVLADADGITVAELRKLAQTHLEILREEV
jgi:chemotaxis protein methyltransferase CheR